MFTQYEKIVSLLIIELDKNQIEYDPCEVKNFISAYGNSNFSFLLSSFGFHFDLNRDIIKMTHIDLPMLKTNEIVKIKLQSIVDVISNPRFHY